MSPRLQARLAGVIAVLTTPAGFAAAAVGSLYVPDDAAATARHILANEMVLRLAVVADVFSVIYIVYTMLLFNLFTPVSRDVSLLAAFFSLVGIGIGTINVMFELAPLVILQAGQSLSGFSTDELHALALMFLKFHAQVYDLGLVLFGAYNMLIGYLIYRSTFMPRVLGVLLAFAGLCYEVNSFATFLTPGLATHLVPYILIPGGSEILVALWLVFAGVNEDRFWRKAAQPQPYLA